MKALLLILGVTAALPVHGLTPVLPSGAEATFSVTERLGAALIPMAAFDGASVPTQWVEGAITRRAWRVMQPGIPTLELMAPLRALAEAEGFEIRFDCAARECGGFDFRYGIEVIEEPEMHVDLGDYRFLSAFRDGVDGPSALTLLISRDSTSSFVQLVEVTPVPVAAQTVLPEAAPIALPEQRLSGHLLTHGYAVLEGISFPSGSVRLEAGALPALEALAEFLRDNPDRTALIVGHTDASGSLPANVAISKRRAEAVRSRLIADHAIPANRLRAEGAGFLAPRFAEPDRNRRVEVILDPVR